MGLRGGEPAARRARLRPCPGRRRCQPAHRRGRRPGQRDPHQRRAVLRRPRPSRVLQPRVHQPTRRGDLGQGRGADHGRGGPPRRPGARHAADQPLQEQHRQQGRVLRHPRELPDEARDAVRRHRAAPHAVLRLPAGGLRLRAGRHRPGRPQRRLPDLPARRLLRGRGRPGDDAQAPDHQHPRRAARGGREVPPAARHHRRRQPRRGLHLPQARHDHPGAGDDRGRLPLRRPRGRPAGRDPARRLARLDAARSSSRCGRGASSPPCSCRWSTPSRRASTSRTATARMPTR